MELLSTNLISFQPSLKLENKNDRKSYLQLQRWIGKNLNHSTDVTSYPVMSELWQQRAAIVQLALPNLLVVHTQTAAAASTNIETIFFSARLVTWDWEWIVVWHIGQIREWTLGVEVSSKHMYTQASKRTSPTVSYSHVLSSCLTWYIVYIP